MKRLMLAGWAMAAACSVHGAVRTLSVGELKADGRVTVTFAGSAAADQALLAGWASGDRGTQATAWTEFAHVGTVLPTDTEKTFEIPAAWRAKSGLVRFFLMSEPLPYAKRFDFITRPVVEADGDLYVDTGVVPNRTLDISVTFRSDQMSGDPAMCPFGVASLVYIMPHQSYPNAYWYDFFGANATSPGKYLDATCVNVFGNPPPRNTDPHEVRMNRNGIWFDGYPHLAFGSGTVEDKTASSTLTLFGRRGSWKQKNTSCAIYSARMELDGMLQRDYVPCAKADGTVTLYDRVMKSFAVAGGTKKATLAFVAGTDVGPDPVDCGETVCASTPLLLTRTLSVVARDRRARTVELALDAPHGRGILFAVAGPEDAGPSYAAWEKTLMVATVEADVTRVTVTLPEAWWKAKDTTRFAWKPTDDLPYDREVAWLHADGEGLAHISSDWRPTTNTTICVDYKADLDVCAFGIMGSFYAFLNGDGKVYYGFFGNKAAAGFELGDLTTDFHVFRLGPTEFSVDGETLAAFMGATLPESRLAFMPLPFRTFDNLSFSKTGNIWMKSAKLWEGDILIRDYVPCVKDGVAGFYDRVLRTFSPSVSDTPFRAGETVVEDGTAFSWSKPLDLTTGLVLVVR